VLKTSVQFRLTRMGVINSPLCSKAAENQLPMLTLSDVDRTIEAAK
jgi:hypothetical protein